jgi:vacuolar-type H+-ATPase subunit E/Vma4
MKLNNDFDTIVDAYVQEVLDGMDSKTMERLVYDLLVDNLQSYNDEELVTEIVENYGNDWFAENEFQEPVDELAQDP